MDDVGITNGCAMVDVPNSRIRMVMAHSATELRCFVSGGGAAGFDFGLVVAVVAMDQSERTVPAGLGQEMLAKVDEMPYQRIDRRTRQAFGIGIVGPINDQGFTDDVLSRHEPPIAAI